MILLIQTDDDMINSLQNYSKKCKTNVVYMIKDSSDLFQGKIIYFRYQNVVGFKKVIRQFKLDASQDQQRQRCSSY